MEVKMMLEKICSVQGVNSFSELGVEKIKTYQKETNEQLGFIEDNFFEDFYKEIKSVFEKNVHRTTAKKILNNAYLKVRDC